MACQKVSYEFDLNALSEEGGGGTSVPLAYTMLLTHLYPRHKPHYWLLYTIEIRIGGRLTFANLVNCTKLVSCWCGWKIYVERLMWAILRIVFYIMLRVQETWNPKHPLNGTYF